MGLPGPGMAVQPLPLPRQQTLQHSGSSSKKNYQKPVSLHPLFNNGLNKNPHLSIMILAAHKTSKLSSHYPNEFPLF